MSVSEFSALARGHQLGPPSSFDSKRLGIVKAAEKGLPHLFILRIKIKRILLDLILRSGYSGNRN